MLRSPKSIIAEIDKLLERKEIDAGNLFDPAEEFRYEPIVQYIKSLIIQSKPETAAHDLFKSIITDVLKWDAFNEVNVGNGFIDFAIRENNGNPILIELKPLFKLIKSKNLLKPEVLSYKEYEGQILKYLKNNEYVILTNLKETFLFSRNALIDFAPFKSMVFTELLNSFLDYQGNLWDTIRRIEDQHVKIDLDKSFFADLKTWYKEFREIDIIKTDRYSKEELIVLLLNKIIFIRTLDDLGLIQFNHIVDEYKNKKDKWEAKGSERILTTFFNELEEYFDFFYDTELFKQKFWDYVDKNKENTNKFLEIFETTLGLDSWNKAFGRGMLHYNYRWIDEDVFGKAYETFIAENKKDSGIFYTPKDITQYMSKSTVDYLFADKVDEILEYIDKDVGNYEEADKQLEKLYQIKIIDTACGSGSFLIKVLKEIYNYYLKIEEATNWVKDESGKDLFDLPRIHANTKKFREKHSFDKPIKLIARIILRHIYGADIDERALETAKTNIWKEAIKLNPKVYNYKKLNGESSHILPNLELNFIRGDSLAEIPIEKQLDIISSKHNEKIRRLFEIRNSYIENPFYPNNIDEAIRLKQTVFIELSKELGEIEKPLFTALEFYPAYFIESGKALEINEVGFHAVIGNPPWEIIKPVEKEFAKKRKGELDIIDFKKWFEKEIKFNREFRIKWEEYKEYYEKYKSIISNYFHYQGVGDPNYYKFFLEKDLKILRETGILSLLIPSGFQTDLGCSDLRNLAFNKYVIRKLHSFENRGYIRSISGEKKTIKLFPDVDSRFKFTIVSIEKTPSHPFNSFDAKFYMHDPIELYERQPINYNFEMVKKFSPKNFSIMEFREQRDYDICTKIRSEHTLISDLEFQFRSEFHMTNDSYLFHKENEIDRKGGASKTFQLFEGKMIHQYNSSFSEPRYFLYENESKQQLELTEKRRIKREYKINKKLIDKIKIDLECNDYRLVYRAIGRSTDERTIICSIIPPNVFAGNSLNYIINNHYKLDDKNKITIQKVNKTSIIVLMTLMNSLTLNYYIRNKISANLNMFYIYELPIPELTKKQKDYLTEAGALLLHNKNDKKKYAPLMKELGIDTKKKIDLIRLRGDIEVFIAKEIYKLSKEDWEHIVSTFIYGSESETKKELDQIISYSIESY